MQQATSRKNRRPLVSKNTFAIILTNSHIPPFPHCAGQRHHGFPSQPSRRLSRVAFATLCASLPRLAIDTPENRADRDEAAMIAVAALHPADGFEAKLAAEVVAADAWVMDSHRLAAEFRNDTAITLRCRAEARCMMREMRCHLRELRRIQAERDKALTAMHPAAMERAGYWFRDATQPEPAAEEPQSAEPAEPEPASLCEAESMPRPTLTPPPASVPPAACPQTSTSPHPNRTSSPYSSTVPAPSCTALDHIARKATVPA